MNNTQRKFISVLSNSIRNNKVTIDYKSININEFLELANEHKVENIIYPELVKDKSIDDKVKESINNNKLSKSVDIKKNISNLYNIFEENKISTIILNGLIFEEIYNNNKQVRSNYNEIFIYEGDVEKVLEILISNNYQCIDDKNSKCNFVFENEEGIVLKIKWKLLECREYTHELKNYEKSIWKRTIKNNIDEKDVFSLAYEDLILYLFINMTNNISNLGLNLRDLCDLTMLVENKGKYINWDSFIMKASTYGVDKFSIIIMILCNQFLKMNIPKEIDINNLNNKKYIKALVNEIFKDGKNEESNKDINIEQEFIFEFEKQNKSKQLQKIKEYINIILPPIDELPEKYDYAKEFKYLLPIAWFSYLLSRVFKKNYTIKEKLASLTKQTKTSVNKEKLLHWMEI